jgi:hypothetical protein
METISQDQLVSDLAAVFPSFASHWASELEDGDSRSKSLHVVFMTLLPFLSTVSPTTAQWQQLADLLSREVAAGGSRANAADTCALEHLHQVKLNKVLRPLLSPAARAMVRA